MIHGGNVWQGKGPAAWLDYSANIRPEGPPSWVKEAIAGAMDRLAYYPDPQMKAARAALSKYLGLPQEFVLPTAGGICAIDLATHLEAEASARFTPCFAEYGMLSENRSLPVESIPLLTAPHAVADPVRQAERFLSEGRVVWLCNPLNPVGCAFRPEQIERLLAVVEDRRGWLVVDEAFIEYCPGHTVVHLIERHERLLVTGSMTKILGVPGVRLGYLCAHPDTLAQISRYQITWELNCFAEAVLCALPEHIASVRADCRTNAQRRAHLTSGLRALGLYVYPSEAAFVLVDTGTDAGCIARELKEKHILVRECLNFEGIDDGRHLRLAVKDEQSNEKLITALKETITCAGNL